MRCGSKVAADDEDEELDTIILDRLPLRQVETDEVLKAEQVQKQNLQYVR